MTRLERVILILIAIIVLYLTIKDNIASRKIDWKGNLVFLNSQEGGDRQIWSDKYDVGLRSDGVVVWRKMQEVSESK